MFESHRQIPLCYTICFPGSRRCPFNAECGRPSSGSRTRRLAADDEPSTIMTTKAAAPTRSTDGAGRIAHFLTSMGRGGSEMRTIDLMGAMKLPADFVAVSGQPAALDDLVCRAGHTLHLERQSVARLGRYVRLLRNRQIRVVHAHLGAASGFVLLCAWLARVPVRIAGFVSEGIGGVPTARRSILLALSRRMVSLFATDIVGVSPGSLTHGWNKRWANDERCRVIPTGIDLERVRQSADESVRVQATGTVVTSIARREPSKNRTRTLTIWEEYARTRASTLILVGSMSDQELALADEIDRRVGAQSRVLVLGERADVGAILAFSDVVLMTSKREGLPGVVLEAIAVGVPVVAADLGGVLYIADNLEGVTALSLAADDESWVSALAAASAVDRRTTLRRGFEKSIFTMDAVIEQHRALWRMP